MNIQVQDTDYSNYLTDKQMAFFPDMITKHPEADIPVKGLRSYLLQAGVQQFIFMEFDQDAEVPAHSHEAQWAVVLDGEIELTIAGIRSTFRRGDTYFINKGEVHSARIFKGYRDLTLFDQVERYRVKSR